MTAHKLEVVIRRPRPHMVVLQIKARYLSRERSRAEARPARCLPSCVGLLLNHGWFVAIELNRRTATVTTVTIKRWHSEHVKISQLGQSGPLLAG